jgi:hypothetical protein
VPDQAGDLARLDREIEAIERPAAAVLLHQPLSHEHQATSNL